MKIKGLRACGVKDSRGNPTVQVELETSKGVFTASCPSGASTGKNEAVVLPVDKAIENINKVIAPKIKGLDAAEQKALDGLIIKLDGTKDKSHLGANAVLPTSIAICRAGAASQKLPLYSYIANLADYLLQTTHYSLPLACFNFIEGGAHTVGRNNLDLQEFMVVPQKKSFKENLILANKVFQNLQKLIEENYGGKTAMGDEGGFAPAISKSEQALFLLKNAIGKEEAKIAVDAAASQFFKNGKYVVEGRELSRKGLVDFYKDLVDRFDIVSVEDPFAEEDFEGFRELNFEFLNYKSETLVVGDDLTTTNINRIKEAYSKKSCNGVIIKPNQIGTVTEAIEAVKLAKSYGWKTVVSHRSGETMDDFIADFSVGVGADFIKSGSPTQPERMVKYSRLLAIENELNKNKK